MRGIYITRREKILHIYDVLYAARYFQGYMKYFMGRRCLARFLLASFARFEYRCAPFLCTKFGPTPPPLHGRHHAERDYDDARRRHVPRRLARAVPADFSRGLLLSFHDAAHAPISPGRPASRMPRPGAASALLRCTADAKSAGRPIFSRCAGRRGSRYRGGDFRRHKWRCCAAIRWFCSAGAPCRRGRFKNKLLPLFSSCAPAAQRAR